MSMTAMLEELTDLRERNEAWRHQYAKLWHSADKEIAFLRSAKLADENAMLRVKLSVAEKQCAQLYSMGRKLQKSADTETAAFRARVKALIEAAQALSNEARVNNGEPELIIDPQTLAELDMAVAVLASNTKN